MWVCVCVFFTDCKNSSAPVIIKSLNHSGNIKQISCNAEAPFSITKISLLLAVSFSFWTFFGCESKMSQANRTQSWPIIIAYNDNRHKFSYLCFIFCWFYMSTHTRTYFLAQVSQQRSRLVCLLLLLVYLKRTENTICLFAKKKTPNNHTNWCVASSVGPFLASLTNRLQFIFIWITFRDTFIFRHSLNESGCFVNEQIGTFRCLFVCWVCVVLSFERVVMKWSRCCYSSIRQIHMTCTFHKTN